MAVALFGLTIFFIALGGMVYGGYVEFMKYLKLVTSWTVDFITGIAYNKTSTGEKIDETNWTLLR